MELATNSVFTVGPSYRGDRSYVHMIFQTIKTNSQYVHAMVLADNASYSRDWWKDRKLVSLCREEFNFAEGMSLLTKEQFRRGVLFRKYGGM